MRKGPRVSEIILIQKTDTVEESRNADCNRARNSRSKMRGKIKV